VIINDGHTANSSRATEKITGTTTKPQKGIRIYRRGLRVASLLGTMVILLCDQFWHRRKYSGLGSKYCVVLITDMGAYYQNWEKVIAAGARRIFPAHGAPFTVDKLKTNLWKNKAENIVPYK
jgi:hypothetical protein